MAFTILGLWLFTAVMFGMGGGLTIFLYTETRSSNYWIYRMIATAAPFLFWYLIFLALEVTPSLFRPDVVIGLARPLANIAFLVAIFYGYELGEQIKIRF